MASDIAPIPDTDQGATDYSLSIIDAANFLSREDQASLAAMAPELRKTWQTAQLFRTDTEMRISVLNDLKRPTSDAKYWQAVREQAVFMEQLVQLSYEYRGKLLVVKRLRRDLSSETDELERERLELEIEYESWQLLAMQRTAFHRMRELRNWSQIKAELEPQLKYGTDDVNAHQLEAMAARWTQEARLVNQNTQPADAFNILGLADAAQRAMKE